VRAIDEIPRSRSNPSHKSPALAGEHVEREGVLLEERAVDDVLPCLDDGLEKVHRTVRGRQPRPAGIVVGDGDL